MTNFESNCYHLRVIPELSVRPDVPFFGVKIENIRGPKHLPCGTTFLPTNKQSLLVPEAMTAVHQVLVWVAAGLRLDTVGPVERVFCSWVRGS